MPVFSGLVVYVLAWWMMFFCILPFNIQSIIAPQDGTMPGAPINPRLKSKIVIATLAAAVVWGVIYLLVISNFISFHAIADRMEM